MNIKNYKIDKLNYCRYCEYDCESVCPIFKTMKDRVFTPRNKALLALDSIKKWDFGENINIYACINCDNCKDYCPHKNDVSEVLNYVKEKIISTENARDKILKFEENFYFELENISFVNNNNNTELKNLPSFLVFYNIGFRDEAITELKRLFKLVKSRKVIVSDISFIYFVNIIRKNLKNTDIPELILKFNSKIDYHSIVTSGLDISFNEVYKKLVKNLNKIK